MTEKDLYHLTSEKNEDINVREFLAKYLRYWYLFLIGLVVSAAIAYTYIQYATPLYEVNGTLLIKESDEKGSMSGDMNLDEIALFSGSNKLDNEIELLKSRSLMERVVGALNLYTTYHIQEGIREREIYGQQLPFKLIVNQMSSAGFGKELIIRIDGKEFELIEKKLDGSTIVDRYQFGLEIRKPYASFTIVSNSGKVYDEDIIVRLHDIRKVADSYHSKLSVAATNLNTSVLNIGLIDKVPQKAVDIINKLIEVYKKETIDDKNQMVANTISFIDDRLKLLTVELSDVEKDVERFKQQNSLTNVSNDAELYLEKASEYNRQLSELEIQIDVLNSIENYLGQPTNENNLVPSSLSIQDPTLLALISKFNELQLQRQRLERSTVQGHPLLVEVDNQLSNLRFNILENIRNIKEGLVLTQRNLEATSNQFKTRIRQVPALERELLEINRQQNIKQGLYLFLLQKREESALSLASTISNSRVIDPPVAEDIPVSPKKRQIVLLALLLGLGVPFAFIYIKELLNDKVKVRKDVERATQTPILGEIIHSKSKDSVVVSETNRTAAAEMFRLIRTNLHFSTLGGENKVILITSSRSGEGKTFFTINLGASLALIGKKVAIVSMDLRKPKMTQYLKLPGNVGVTNYLISDAFTAADIATDVPNIPGLFAITTGPIPPNPGELMTSDRVGKLILELRERFDYVLIDSAPVGQVADAFTLAHHADSTIYVVRYNYTYKDQLAILEDVYQHNKLKHPMIVLNDAMKKNVPNYGYGYGYGHTNGNGAPNRSKRKMKKGSSIKV